MPREFAPSRAGLRSRKPLLDEHAELLSRIETLRTAAEVAGT